MEMVKTNSFSLQTESFRQVGGNVLANACGPCIGQWDRYVMYACRHV